MACQSTSFSHTCPFSSFTAYLCDIFFNKSKAYVLAASTCDIPHEVKACLELRQTQKEQKKRGVVRKERMEKQEEGQKKQRDRQEENERKRGGGNQKWRGMGLWG